uniref:Uncharacterized protein n=1 Tax=Anopheles arabiensis TaxID=7173 RepID=A0A182I4B0_ANOAR
MIMKRLEELFGRPELIYQELLRDVTRIRVDSNKIPELSEAIEALVTNIEIMDEKSYLYDHRLIDEIENYPIIYKPIGWNISKPLSEMK